MKVLLIVEKDSTKDILSHHLSRRGFDIIRYANPIKAMDNIEEIAPELVLFSAEDFPRHWKPFMKILREVRNKEETVFILLKGKVFPFEEAAKASFLGVNGIIREEFDREGISALEEVFSRYSPVEDGRISRRLLAKQWDDIEFLFTHPVNLKLVGGKIVDISIEGVSFLPDDPRITQSIKEGSRILSCSLKICSTIHQVTCRVARNNQLMGLHFIDLPDDIRQELIDYIDNAGARELENILKSAK